ncbi:MAG: hypothetical protein U1F16_15450 [Turneriella sp.]
MDAALPTQPRSGIPKVMGVLLIVFASIYTLGSVLGAIGALFGDAFMNILPTIADSTPEIKKSGINLEQLFGQLRGVYRVQGLEKLATAAISAYGIYAGTQLMHYSAQGVRLAIWWAMAALAYLVVEVWIFAIYIHPLLTKFFKTLTHQVKPLMGKDAPAIDALPALVGSMGYSSTIIYAVIMAIFPVLMLVLLNTPGAKRACGVEKIF